MPVDPTELPLSRMKMRLMPKPLSGSSTAQMPMVSMVLWALQNSLTQIGQPIRLTAMPPSRSHYDRPRNPFDSAVQPARSLADRITLPNNRSRSRSPVRRSDVSKPPPEGVDRYVPGQSSGRRSRSPLPRRDGRRAGARRDRGDRTAGGERGGREGGGRNGGRNQRPKKTQEELDAEMADYFNGGGNEATEGTAHSEEKAPAAVDAGDDIDMIQ